MCKKRYAMSSLSTASISCLAINQSIKKRNKKKRSSSVFPCPVYLFSDDRWRDIKIDEAAIKLLNWFHLAPTSCFIDILWWSIESRTIGGYFSNLSRFVSCPIIVDKKKNWYQPSLVYRRSVTRSELAEIFTFAGKHNRSQTFCFQWNIRIFPCFFQNNNTKSITEIHLTGIWDIGRKKLWRPWYFQISQIFYLQFPNFASFLS